MDLRTPIPQDAPAPAPSVAPGPAAPTAPGLNRWKAAALVVVALGVAARFVTPSSLWLDEALSVNIARLPLGDIPGALRQDGAPPLYYVLLHGWMELFGSGTSVVRAFSGLFGVAALPLVWMAGRRLGGERVAWAALVLLAVNPFAIRYATEARMYSMLMVLVLVGFLALGRVLEGGGRGATFSLALVSGLVLLTHYWGFYLVAAVVGALVLAARGDRPERRRRARRALVAVLAGGVLFIPWAPVFVAQLAATGTPWGEPPSLRSLFDTVTHFAGGYDEPGIPLSLLYFGLLVLGCFGHRYAGGPEGRGGVLLRWGAAPRARPVGAVVLATLVVAVVASLLGDSAFAPRYTAVVLPLLVLVLAAGLAVVPGDRAAAAVLGVATVLAAWASLPNLVGQRTSAPEVAAALRDSARPGDLVVYCPDQLGPSVSRLVPDDLGLVHLTFPRAGSPELVDWRDYGPVNRAAVPSQFARMLVQRAGSEHDIWVVWAPGYRTFGTKCQKLLGHLEAAHPDVTEVVEVSPRYFERPGLVRVSP